MCRIPEKIPAVNNPGGVFALGTDIMDNPGDAKYGMTTEQIFEAFKQLKELGVKEFGIHSFLASKHRLQMNTIQHLQNSLFELAVKLKEEVGVHIGIYTTYLVESESLTFQIMEGNDIAVIGEGVHKVYDEVLVPAGMGDVKIFTELGRYMLAPNGHLVTKAIHEKHTHKEYIGVDACAVNLMRPCNVWGVPSHHSYGKENEPAIMYMIFNRISL